MLKLYGQYRSRCFRVCWMLKETGIPYEHVNVSIHVDDAACKEDWYRKLNPNARVPTIDDDGFIMWESGAINLYLAQKYDTWLWPSDMPGRGRALQWAFYIANDVEPPQMTVFQHRYRYLPEKRIPRLADEAEPILLPRLRILDDHLGGTPYFQGKQWGLADFMVASVLFSLHEMQYERLAEFPRLSAWLAASVARPAAVEAARLRTAA